MRILAGFLSVILAVFPGACAFMPEEPDDGRVVWTENFEADLARWVPREAEWTIEGGVLTHPDPHFRGGVLMIDDLVLGDFVVEAEMQVAEEYWLKDDSWVGFIVRGGDPVHYGWLDEGYLALVRASGEAGILANGRDLLGSTEKAAPTLGRFVRVRVEAQGDEVVLSVDGREAARIEHDGARAGSVALVHYGNRAVFDNVVVQGVLGTKETTVDIVQPNQPIPEEHAPVEPLERIGVRETGQGEHEFYVRSTGERFWPRGFNHTTLHEAFHSTFNTASYDAGRLEKRLAHMAEVGANCVRVWAWGGQGASGTGFTGTPDARGLNKAYMENFVQFLRMATRHGLYVVPIFDETPHNAYYDSITRAGGFGDSRITGYNTQYLAPGPIASKAQAVQDFVGYIKKSDPNLLPTILGWSFANEVFVSMKEGPFFYNEGIVIPANGKAYDLSVNEERQACWDESIVYWANQLEAAVKDVDPEGLTNAGMWTAEAHERPAVNYLLPDNSDPRIPPRPGALGSKSCDLDWLDIHVYPWRGKGEIDPAAHERDLVQKPAIVGEYGTFHHMHPLEDAPDMLKGLVSDAFALGYDGMLFWIYDLTEFEHPCYSAVDGDLARFVMDFQAMQETQR